MDIATVSGKPTQLTMHFTVDHVHGPNASPTSIARVVAIAHTISDATTTFFLSRGSSWILVIEETVDVRTCAFFATTNPVDGLNTGTGRSGVGRFTVTAIDLGVVPVRGGQCSLTGPGIVVQSMIAMGTTGPVAVTEFFRDHIVAIGVSTVGYEPLGTGTRDPVVGRVAVTGPATLNDAVKIGLVE